MAGDPRFFAQAGPLSLAAVAAGTGAQLSASADGAALLHGLATLREAGAEHLGFLDNRRYLPDLRATRAGAVILHPDLAAALPAGTVGLLTPTPYLAWARAGRLFHPEPAPVAGVHPSAAIDPTASIDASAEIGPFVFVGPAAVIGPGCRLEAHAAIGAGVVLGAGCRIGMHASLSHAVLGQRVRVFSGARIGEAGFGFAPSPQGFVGVPQLGRVLIGDEVEIGANTTIDRGAGPDTVIGAGTRIDNLVQIGHNVRLGKSCVVVAMAGISGSTEVGDYVQIAAQVGIAGHLRIGDRARIGGKAGVMNDIAAGQDVVGSPAEPARDHFKSIALLRRLVKEREAKGRQAASGPEETQGRKGEQDRTP
jgi:UDP-3-O-[3-hydroxymyristoyl] glucosamine N-acyltransferase